MTQPHPPSSGLSKTTRAVLCCLAALLSSLTVLSSSFFSLLFWLPLCIAIALLAVVLTASPDKPDRLAPGELPRTDEQTGEPVEPSPLLAAFMNAGPQNSVLIQSQTKYGPLYSLRALFSRSTVLTLLLSALLSYGIGLLYAALAYRELSGSAFLSALSALFYLLPAAVLYGCTRRRTGRTVTVTLMTAGLCIALVLFILLLLYATFGSLSFAPLQEMLDQATDTMRTEMLAAVTELNTMGLSISEDLVDTSIAQGLVLMPAIMIAIFWLLCYLASFLLEWFLTRQKLPHLLPRRPWVLVLSIPSGIVFCLAVLAALFAPELSPLSVTAEWLTLLLAPPLFFIGVRGLVLRIRLRRSGCGLPLILLCVLLFPLGGIILLIFLGLFDTVRLQLYTLFLPKK